MLSETAPLEAVAVSENVLLVEAHFGWCGFEMTRVSLSDFGGLGCWSVRTRLFASVYAEICFKKKRVFKEQRGLRRSFEDGDASQ